VCRFRIHRATYRLAFLGRSVRNRARFQIGDQPSFSMQKLKSAQNGALLLSTINQIGVDDVGISADAISFASSRSTPYSSQTFTHSLTRLSYRR